MTYNAEQMLIAMNEASQQYPLLPGLVYRSFYDFVAAHGREYSIVPYKGLRGAQFKCFANAIIHGALRGLRYVEGFALAPDGRLILHGWNADDDGNVVDCTWCNTGLAYIGVEFSLERADDALWNGDANILNDENRNYPVFQKPWTGEDYSLVWPASDRLNALRRGDLALALSVFSQ